MSRIHRATLDNGIRVITEEMADVESVAIGIWVKTGSRYERPVNAGISHFIEHLLFKGTKNRTAHDIAREIESVGGVLNAFTGREYTCFYAKVLAKDLPRATELLADMFMNSLFDPEEMDRERQVVLQEIRMVDDTPDDLIHDLYAQAIWNTSAMGRSVLGTKKSVKSISREAVKRYIKNRYNPESVFITVSGKVGNGKFLKTLKSTFGAIGKGGPWRPPQKPKTRSGVAIYKRDLEQVHICLGVPAIDQTSKDRYGVYLMNTILGGGMSSRLFQEIREKRGLAYSVYSYLNLCLDTGTLVVYVGTTNESVKEVLSLLLGELNRLNDMTELAVSVLGTKKSVKSISREAVKRYIKNRYNPESVFITVSGKVGNGKFLKTLKSTFGAIGKGGPWRPPQKPKTRSGVAIYKRDLEQVHICLGVPAIDQTSKDRYGVYLMNTILGGGMSSRLFQEIREKRGLAYSVYSYLNLCLDTGTLVVYVGTTNESVKEVLSLLLGELNRLNDMTELELTHAKDQLKGF